MPIELMMRYGLGVGAGIVVTTLLFYLMQAVIHTDKNPLNEAPNIRLIDFVRVLEDHVVQEIQRLPEPPPPPDEAPPDLPEPSFDSDASLGVSIGYDSQSIDIGLGGSGLTSDGEYLPIVKPQPIYPRRAQQRGIEGWVILEFCVTPQGTVRDPRVVDADPLSIFDRSAMQGALKFKYKPKYVDGVAVEVCGVRNRVTYEMEDA